MLIERLLKVALLGSEWVLYLLVLLSVLSLTTVVERWIYFGKRTQDLDELRKQLVKRLDAGDVAGATALLAQGRSVEAAVAHEALRWAHAGADAITDAVDAELARLKKDLERGTNFLGTVGNNAPFVGLFGTVLGVIIAFEALGKTGENAGAMGSVMAGIAEALVATGVGLFVALPAVVAYNIIQKRIGEIETDSIAFTKLIAAYARAHAGQFSAPVSGKHATESSAASQESTPPAAADQSKPVAFVA